MELRHLEEEGCIPFFSVSRRNRLSVVPVLTIPIPLCIHRLFVTNAQISISATLQVAQLAAWVISGGGIRLFTRRRGARGEKKRNRKEAAKIFKTNGSLRSFGPSPVCGRREASPALPVFFAALRDIKVVSDFIRSSLPWPPFCSQCLAVSGVSREGGVQEEGHWLQREWKSGTPGRGAVSIPK